MSAKSRITRAFKEAKILPLNSQSKYVLFSDCHRGDNSFADDFAHNRKIYTYALSQYFNNGFTYIELGDGDDLWENSFKKIFRANKEVFMILKKFHEDNRLHFIWGNHDMRYQKAKHIIKNYHYYFDRVTSNDKELMINPSFSEAIKLEQEDGKSIFLLHGHQADWFNYNCWRLSAFLVKILWKPLQLLGIDDPTSPAKNFKELIKVEKHFENWIKENNNQMIITGHTHRPRFPSSEEVPFFNDGSCVHPRCITGLEIENGGITLIKWHLITNKDGAIQIIRSVLEGSENISKYF